MIEVTARPTQPVYLAGEVVECAITLRNPSPPPGATSQWNDQEETLGWVTAQIHCRCWVNESKVSVPTLQSLSTEEKAITNSRTSFAPCGMESVDVFTTGPATGSNPGTAAVSTGGSARVVISTKPVILFCDLRLLPGESKTFWYKETLPMDGPPSFRGQTVKYAYKVTIGTQRINSPIRLLHVPLRVLVLQEFTDSVIITDNEELAPSNPFLSDKQKESPLDTAMQILQMVSSQRTQKYYNLTNSKGHVVKFCAFKHAFKLGDDIVGALDFSGSTSICVQYAVTLQSVEEVSPECRKTEAQKPSVSSFSKTHEMCIGFQQTHFILPVPPHVTPSFFTDLISLKWRLHFEFVTSSSSAAEVQMKALEPPPAESLDGKVWHAPAGIDIETMSWDLPVKLYPNLPSHLSQGMQSTAQYELRF